MNLYEITAQTRVDGDIGEGYLHWKQVRELKSVPKATHILRVSSTRGKLLIALQDALTETGATLCMRLTKTSPRVLLAAVCCEATL